MSASPAVVAGSENAVALYEELRQCVLVQAGACACACDLGQIFLLRGGVVAWMAHGTTRTAPTNLTADRGRDATAPVLSDEIHTDMVRVLASMALAGRKEMTP